MYCTVKYLYQLLTTTTSRWIVCVFVIVSYEAIGQITSNTAISTGTTQYTNGNPNDPIFYYCAGQTGSLTATPAGGTPNYNFVWQQFNAVSNSWAPYTIQNNLATSTLTNLPAGGYRVTITDNQGVVVGTYIAWIRVIQTNPTVNAFPITPGCGNVTLTGQVSYGSITPYYNLPTGAGPDPGASIIIDANTEITVCFTGNHTFVSDLAFHLQGPPSCGNPNITLAASPGICNGGDNFNNICFSTESTNNFNVCGAPVPLTGTYGSYGAGNTPINWAPLYGCDATQLGWSLQVWDCVGGDSGNLTSATLTISGTTVGGNPGTVTYSSGPINSAIAVTSCNAAVAANYTVATTPATAVTCTNAFQWTADPPFTIPNSTTSLNIPLVPGPTVTTVFTLSLTNGCVPNACGGTTTDSETFIYTPPVQAEITTPGPYCTDDGLLNLQATPAGGTWTGTGIMNAATGAFDPSALGAGDYNITYGFSAGCTITDNETISVLTQTDATITDPGALCFTAAPFFFTAATPGGVWSGPGVISGNTGLFSPAFAGVGTHEIFYTLPLGCNHIDSIDVEVVSFVQPVITIPSTLCTGDGIQNFTVDVIGGTWSGPGITDGVLGTFDPASAGTGNHNITYQLTEGCITQVTENINIIDFVDATITPQGDLCESMPAVDLTAATNGGVWSGPGITDDIEGIFDPAVAGPGSHTITYEYDGGCYGIDDITINVQAETPPTFDPVAPFCVNDPAQNITSTVPGGTWSGTGITNALLGTFNPALAGVGTHTLTYAISGLCSAQNTIDVEVNGLPAPNIGADVQICPNETATLDAGAGWISIDWSTGSDDQTITVSAAGVYTATVTDANGCSNSDGVQVNVVNVPMINLGQDLEICSNNDATLTSGYTGLWSTGETGTSITVNQSGTYWFLYDDSGCTASDTVGVTTFDPPFVELGADMVICPDSVVTIDAGVDGNWSTGAFGSSIDVNQTGVYSVNVFAGPCLVSDEVSVDVLPLPIADLPETITYCNGEILTLDAFHPYNITYAWSTGALTPETSTTIGGDFTVEVGNTCGMATATVHVVFEDCTFAIWVPNAFTPDNDGLNDYWKPEVFNLRTYELIIFNRWGEVIFRSTDPEQAWTGEVRENGEYFVNDGVYPYMIKYNTNTGEGGEKVGYITILR